VAVEIGKILDAIRSGRWQTQVEEVRAAFATGGKDAATPFKKSLPAMTPSRRFNGPHRADALVEHSGLLCLDLDDLGDQLTGVRVKLADDPHCFALFTSPTGFGLKFLMKIPQAPAGHGAAFDFAADYFKRTYDLDADPACRDVCRLCFVSYDSELVHRPDAQHFTFTPAHDPAGAYEWADAVNVPGHLKNEHGQAYSRAALDGEAARVASAPQARATPP